MDQIPDDLLDYQCACVFCKSGCEQSVSQAIMRLYPGLHAMPVSQLKHQSVKGVKLLKKQIFLPGYVFIYVPFGFREIDLYACGSLPDVFRLLTDGEGRWALQGGDEAFARWAFKSKGLVGLSQAYMAGDKVQFLSGPLKEREGNIVKVDKRGRNGLISVEFDGRTWRFWLAFEYTSLRVMR